VSSRAVRVLIIDPDVSVREQCKRLLAEDEVQSYDFLEAADGACGLAIVREQGPECVLLRFGLPDMDGVKLVNRIDALVSRRPIATVMLTSQDNAEIEGRAVIGGAQEIVSVQDLGSIELHKVVQRALVNSALQDCSEKEVRSLRDRIAALEVENRELREELEKLRGRA